MTPLSRLLAAVEAGEWTMSLLMTALSKKQRGPFMRTFEGSTDAAISLCGAMLPDGSGNGGTSWSKSLSADRTDHNGKEVWTATIHDGSLHTSCDVLETADDPDPARAMLIAMLRAAVSMEGGK